jgi:hypothetical protein
MYIGFFWYGKALSSAVWSRWPKNLGAAFPLVLFCVGNCILGGLDEHYQPMWTWRRPPDLTLELFVDSILTALLMICLYMLADGPWLSRLRLVEAGSASLGTYIIHWFFFGYCAELARLALSFKVGVLGIPRLSIIPVMESVRPWGGSLAMFIVWLAYPLIFSITIGTAFQKGFLSGFTAVEKGFLRMAAGANTAWKATFKPQHSASFSKQAKGAA